MKQWLKTAIPVALLFAAFIALFVIEEKKIAALSQTEDCPLCRLDNAYHAPLVMNLTTGEVLELRVYEPHPIHAFELAEDQSGGYARLVAGAGLVVICDTTTHTASVTMPEEMGKINEDLFCRGCRSLLTAADAEGYAIISSYASEPLGVYAVKEGAMYEIRDYAVTISRDDRDRLEVNVVGTL